MKLTRRYLAIVVAALLGVATLWCTRHSAQPQQWHDNVGVVWTTDYHITYMASSNLSDSIQAVLQAIDRSASVYNSKSLVSQFNAGQTVMADAILDTLCRVSRMVWQQSGGAFDPTVMPLVNAGESVKLFGVFKNHPTYGEQFAVSALRIKLKRPRPPITNEFFLFV